MGSMGSALMRADGGTEQTEISSGPKLPPRQLALEWGSKTHGLRKLP